MLTHGLSVLHADLYLHLWQFCNKEPQYIGFWHWINNIYGNILKKLLKYVIISIRYDDMLYKAYQECVISYKKSIINTNIDTMCGG